MNDKKSEFSVHSDDKIAGTAALSLCESLLITLNDEKILDDHSARCVIEDAASTHVDASKSAADPALHLAVAGLLTRIKDGKNSVRKFK